MPEETLRSVHINQPVTNLSIGYHPKGMIAERVVAVVPVVKESDFFYKWNKGEAFRRVDTRRADGTRANRVSISHTRDTYLCEEYALEHQITDRQRANADSLLRLELSLTRRLQDMIALDQEGRVADLLRTAGNYASTNKVTLSGTSQWNNASFSGSIEQVMDDAKEAVRLNTGNNSEVEMVIIPQPVALVIKRDAMVREVIKYTRSDLLVNGELPPVLWNMEVVIPRVVEDSTNREVYGTDTFTGTDMWGKDVILTSKPQAPSIDSFAHTYIFRSRDLLVEQWRDDSTSSNWYRVGYIQTEKLISNVGGYLITSAIS